MKGTTRKIAIQEEGVLNFLRPLLTAGLSLMKNVLTTLAKSVLVPFGLTAAASGIDAAIQKKISGSGTTLVFSNENLNDIMKIVKSLEDAGLMMQGVTETVKNEVKEQKEGFLGMLDATLGSRLSGNMLADKGVVRCGDGVIGACEEIVRVVKNRIFIAA